MTGRDGQELLSTWVPADLAAAFKAQARAQDGGVSAALRRLVAEQTQGALPPIPAGTGRGQQVGVRLKAPERSALAQAAQEHGTSPANWLRSLALAHLTRTPQWNPAELQALREVFAELRRIGTNVNQIAHALNLAVKVGQVPREGAHEAQRAADAVRVEMRRVVGLMTGNFAYWGVPQDPRPTPTVAALEDAAAAAQRAEAKRRGKPRRPSPRFAEP